MLTELHPEFSVPDSIMEEFSLFVARQTGLHFPRERWPDLSRAMAAMSGGSRCDETLTGFRSLVNGPAARSSAELLASHLAIGETYFFREPAMFQALEHEVLPPLVASRRNTGKYLRIWSAGCCSGEELYSMAIVLERTIPDLQDWNLTLLGTDIQPQFLQKARHGLYRDWSFRSVPDWIRQSYFRRDEQGNHAIAPALRRRVTFEYLNLITDIYPGHDSGTAPMDIVLCRNVLMYFEPAQAAQVIAKLHRAIASDGWLVVSSAEAGGEAFARFDRHRFGGVTFYRNQVQEMKLPELPESPGTMPEQAVSSHSTGTRKQSARSLAEQARRFADQGLLNEANRLCKAAIDADKCDPALRYLHALILEEQGCLDAATEALNHALYLDPFFVLAHFTLGNLCRRRCMDREAARHFANALDLLHRHAPGDTLTASEGMSASHLVHAMGLGRELE